MTFIIFFSLAFLTDSEAILMALDRQQPEKMLNEKNMGNCFGFDVSY
jgi:hypothetical protein